MLTPLQTPLLTPLLTHVVSLSPEIMKDLVKDKDSALWQCWLAHVAEVRFLNRSVFHRSRDGPEITRLSADFFAKFEKVTAWKGREKPKFHLGEHLEQVSASALHASPCTHRPPP